MPFAINDSKIADSDYSEVRISCIKKTVKQEDALVRQIVYTMLSAYSNNPINLGIIAPTSEGKSYPVWIPFGLLLAEILPSNKGSDSRITNRIYALLNIIPLTKAHLRPKLVYGLETHVIATLEDLREVLQITQDVTGMVVHKFKFYREFFLPLYRSKSKPTVDSGKSESRIALTSREICDYYNSKRDTKLLTTDNLKKTFLDELLNHGYIEQETSTICKTKHLLSSNRH